MMKSVQGVTTTNSVLLRCYTSNAGHKKLNTKIFSNKEVGDRITKKNLNTLQAMNQKDYYCMI